MVSLLIVVGHECLDASYWIAGQEVVLQQHAAFSNSDASVRSCPAFADVKARLGHDPSIGLRAILPGRQRLG